MLAVKYTLLSAACRGLPMQKFIVKTCENTYGEIINAPEERNSKKKREINNATLVKIVDQYKHSEMKL